MPRYRFLLHDGPTTPPVTEALDIGDDLDAVELARLRLLTRRDYTHAEVYRGAYLVREIRRDTYPV